MGAVGCEERSSSSGTTSRAQGPVRTEVCVCKRRRGKKTVGGGVGVEKGGPEDGRQVWKGTKRAKGGNAGDRRSLLPAAPIGRRRQDRPNC